MTTAARFTPLVPRKLHKHVYTAVTNEGANIGCIATEDGAISIDLPLSAAAAITWRAEIARLTPKPLRAVIFTSPERFSSEALAALMVGRMRMPGVLHDNGYQVLFAALESSYPHAPELGLPFHVREQAGLPELTFSERSSYTLGGKDNPVIVDAMHVGGCAPGGAFVMARDSGVVFTGDHVAVNEPPVFGAGDFDKWLKALAGLPRNKHVRMVVPGRGAAGDASIAAGTVEFIKALKAAVAKFMRKEHTREDLGPLAAELFASLDYKKRSHSDEEVAPELLVARIRTGLEAIYDASRKETQAIIV